MQLNSNYVDLGKNGGLVDLRTEQGTRALLDSAYMEYASVACTTANVALVVAAAEAVPGVIVARTEQEMAALTMEICAHSLPMGIDGLVELVVLGTRADSGLVERVIREHQNQYPGSWQNCSGLRMVAYFERIMHEAEYGGESYAARIINAYA